MSQSNKKPPALSKPITRCPGAYVYPPETSGVGVARCKGEIPELFPKREFEEESEPSTSLATSSVHIQADESVLSVETIRAMLSEKLGFFCKDNPENECKEKVLECLTLKGLANYWKNGCIKKVVTMVGAGISTSAGIPDFRSPGSGLYNNLEKYELPRPMAIFELDFFKKNPKPFFTLAKELYPGIFKPTPCHYFIRMLNDKKLLTRHYTQNIDTLERITKIPSKKLVEAHGTFFTNHCIDCKQLYSMDWMKEQIFDDVIPTCETCNSIVKPDIVFFGENLPNSFYEYPENDFKDCDLLIIMGTSLEVQPFASLVEKVNKKCIRLLINRDKVGNLSDALSSWLLFGPGLKYDSPNNQRDIAYIGDCDEGVYELADLLGWGDELRNMVATEHALLDEVDYTESSEDNYEEEDKAVDEKYFTGGEEEEEDDDDYKYK